MDLPRDVLLIIFSYSSSTCIKNLALACKIFNNTLQDINFCSTIFQKFYCQSLLNYFKDVPVKTAFQQLNF